LRRNLELKGQKGLLTKEFAEFFLVLVAVSTHGGLKTNLEAATKDVGQEKENDGGYC
jgi:hypothetical protein